MTVKRHHGLGKQNLSLTKNVREDIIRRMKFGHISASHARMLLYTIDCYKSLLEEVITYGQDWDDEQWTTFTEPALLLLDEKPARLSS